MKKITIFLFVCCLLCSNSYSQTKSKPIESGFVFIDGKYIEAPYVVESKGLSIFINNIQIAKGPKWPPADYRVDKDPGLPVGVDRTAGLAALDNIRGDNGVPHMGLKIRYLYQHFPEEEAREKVIAYFKSLPYLQRVDIVHTYILELEDFHGKTELVDISYVEIDSPKTQEEYESDIENVRNSIVARLTKEDCIFYFGFSGELSLSGIKAARVLPKVLHTKSNSLYDLKTKKSVLDQLGIVRSSNKWGEVIIKNQEINEQLTQRLDKLRDQILKEYGPDFLQYPQESVLLNGDDIPSGRSAGTSYSPDGTYLYIYYVNAYEHLSTYNSEMNSIRDHITDQNYDITTCILYDATDDDNDPGACTLENWKECKYADVLSINSHGNNGFFCTVFLKDKDTADAWRETETYMHTLKSGSMWWGDPPYHPYYVMARKNWVSLNWNTTLTQSKAIVLVNSCNSSDSSTGYSFLAGCGGEVGFGYPGSVNLSDRLWNNNQLFQRMNGTVGNGQYRTSGEAYDNMTEHKDDFEMIGNPNSTLCPATEDFYPQNWDEVDDSGTGFFQVDTYCHDSVAADEALTFETEGDVTIDSVYWVGSGMVNRIEYNWTGTGKFKITPTVHHDKFRSWGVTSSDYHVLDFDGIAPNTEDGTYYFGNCPDPSNLTADSITTNSALLGWTQGDGISNWNIMLDTTGFDTTGVTPASVSINPFTASGLMPDTYYDWYLRAYCGDGLWSNWVGQHTFTTPCFAPSDLSASNVDTISATLSWGSTANSWEIIISSSSFDPMGMSGSGASNPYQVSGLSPSTTYYWAVRASCEGGGFSFWTGPISFTTTDSDDDDTEFLAKFDDSGQQLGSSHHTAVDLGDLDGDGDLDAAVTSDQQNAPTRVWLNDGNANFIDSGLDFGFDKSLGIALGDLDDDGDLDGFIANDGPNKVYLNDGVYTTDNGQSLGNAESHDVSLADLDGDGDLDAAVANKAYGQPNKVWLNNGNGTFTAFAMDFGNAISWGMALGDLDGDGDIDGFIANDGPNKVYLNDGPFTDDNGQNLGNSSSKDIQLGDLDGDGYPDAVIANDTTGQPNIVWLNDGDGDFTDSGLNFGDNLSMGLALGDLDGDGDLDGFVANNGPNKVYLNDGTSITDNGQSLGNSNSYGVALGDLDGDGDLDAFVANYDGPNKVWLNQTVEYQVESIHPSSGANTNLQQFAEGITVENGYIDAKVEAADYVLENYPDPFTSTTTIKFKVGTTEMTTLKVYNTYGYVVAELYNGFAQAGSEYFFTFDGRNMLEGIYILYLQSGNKISAKEKMVLIN